jgi:protein phosphatase
MSRGPRVDVDMAALSHAGKVRSNNEDHYLAVRFERTAQTLLTNLSEAPAEYLERGYGLVVADGVGGSAAGEVASSTAVRVLLQLALETPDWIMSFDAKRAGEVLERMEVRFRKVKDAFVQRAEAEPALAGMGTTMTLACTAGINLIIAHIGDSRAYLFRRGELHQLTRDQTVAQTLADAGAIRPEEVATHPRRHILTGAITTRRSEASTELHHLELADGDQLLLCTDGLTDMTTDAAITGALGRSGSPEEGCQALVDLALEGGGKDNVTVVLARYRIQAPA